MLLGDYSIETGLRMLGGDAVSFGEIDLAFEGYLHTEDEAPSAADAKELLLKCYERLGARLSEDLFGGYAIVLHDRARKRFVLAHDQLGLKPLYYSTRGGALSFSTKVKALARHVGASFIEERYFADLLLDGDHDGALTPYRDIYRLAPGRNLVVEAGRVCEVIAWRRARIDYGGWPETRLDERFRELFEAAVRTSAGGARRVACELSGGLDSSSVLSLASRCLPEKPAAISYVYSQSLRADETPWIDRAANHCGVRSLRIDTDLCRPLCGDVETATDLPSAIGLRPKWRAALYALIEAEGVDVLLTGEGGDAVLWGDLPDPFFVADELRRGRMARFFGEAGTWAAAERGQRSRLFGVIEYGVKPLARYLQNRPFRKPLGEPDWLEEGFVARHRRRRPSALPKTGSVGEAQTFRMILRSARVIADFYEQIEIPASIRHPILHMPLVDFMLSIPWNQKRRPGIDRVIQRRSLKGILSDDTRLRTNKGGSDQPWAEGMAGEDGWRDWLSQEPRLVNLGYVEPASWQAALDGFCVGRCSSLFHFQAALTAEVWLRNNEALDSCRR